jgi:hypothetical protein
MNRDGAERLLRLAGQWRDVGWWIVGIVFRHVPDMAAITAAAVVHLCVFAQSRKPLNMFRWTDRASEVGYRGQIEAEASKFRARHEDVCFWVHFGHFADGGPVP